VKKITVKHFIKGQNSISQIFQNWKKLWRWYISCINRWI